MTEKQFLDLHGKFRLMSEFDNERNAIPDTNFISCNNGKVRIYWYNESLAQILILGQNINKHLDNFGKLLDSYDECGSTELIGVFEWKHLEDILKFLKPKTMETRVPLNSVRNYRTWLRANRYISNRYNDLLLADIEEEKKRRNNKEELMNE